MKANYPRPKEDPSMVNSKTNIEQIISNQKRKNILLVISGPTCAGKDSIVRELLKKDKKIQRLMTTNSRPKRPDEKEGFDYYFVTRQAFEKLINEDALFEWVEYRGDFRGTQKKHVRQALESGKDVIWRIDVRGVKNIYDKVKKEIPNSAFVFLAESLPVLEARMKRRASEDKKWRDWSLARAAWELKQYKDFDYLVWNKEGNLAKTVEIVKMILEAEKRKVK